MGYQRTAAPVAAPTVTNAPAAANGAQTVTNILQTGQSVEVSAAEWQDVKSAAQNMGAMGGELRLPSDLIEAAKDGLTLVSCVVSKAGVKVHRSRAKTSVYGSIAFQTNHPGFNPQVSGRILCPSDLAPEKLVINQPFQLELEVQPDGNTVYGTANFG